MVCFWVCIGHLVRHVKDFDPLGPPFPGGILPCGDADLLACTETFSIALVTLMRRNTLTKHHDRVRNLNPPQHPISALNEIPSRNQRLVGWRLNDLSAERTIDCR